VREERLMSEESQNKEQSIDPFSLASLILSWGSATYSQWAAVNTISGAMRAPLQGRPGNSVK
jgi:hypothetical protein